MLWFFLEFLFGKRTGKMLACRREKYNVALPTCRFHVNWIKIVPTTVPTDERGKMIKFYTRSLRSRSHFALDRYRIPTLSFNCSFICVSHDVWVRNFRASILHARWVEQELSWVVHVELSVHGCSCMCMQATRKKFVSIATQSRSRARYTNDVLTQGRLSVRAQGWQTISLFRLRSVLLYRVQSMPDGCFQRLKTLYP